MKSPEEEHGAASAQTLNMNDFEPRWPDSPRKRSVERADGPVVMTIEEVLAMPRERWLVKHVIGQGRLSVWYGPPGSGKSFLLTHVAACIATGREVFGRRVGAGLVIYVAAEGMGGFPVRIRAMIERGLLDPGAAFRLVPVALDLASDGTDAHRLLDAIKPHGPAALIVVDTVARSLGGSDEDAEAFAGLIRACDAIRAATGAHVALVHHVGKDASRGPRGHSSLLGAVDTAVEIARGDLMRTATIVKQRDGAEGSWLTFRLEQIEVGTDEDGEPETSCIVVEAGAARAPRRRPGGQSGIALDALENLFVADERMPAPHAPDIQRDATVVPVERWRKEALRRGLCATRNNPDTQRKAFHRSKLALISSGWVTCREIEGVEVAWLPGHVHDMSGTGDGDVSGTDRDNTLRGVPSVPSRSDESGRSAGGPDSSDLSKVPSRRAKPTYGS